MTQDYGLIQKNWWAKFYNGDPRHMEQIHRKWKATGKAMRSPAWELGSWYVS
jgi:hypothetical protein